MAGINRPPIALQGQGPNGTDLMAFDADHSISDIVRYAVACSGGDTVETRCICDWIEEEHIDLRLHELKEKAEESYAQLASMVGQWKASGLDDRIVTDLLLKAQRTCRPESF